MASSSRESSKRLASSSESSKRQKNDIMESEEIIELLFDSDISDSEISFSSSNEEEVFSSEDENDASCPTMTWEKIDESYRTHTYHFDSSSSGINEQLNLNDISSPYDYFRSFVSNELISKIVEYSNNFYKKKLETTDVVSPHSLLKRFRVLDNDTFITFLALTMLMPHVKNLDCVITGQVKQLLKHRYLNNICPKITAFPFCNSSTVAM